MLYEGFTVCCDKKVKHETEVSDCCSVTHQHHHHPAVKNKRRKGMSEQHRIFNIDQWLHIRRHYRANLNSTFPSLQYIWNYLTINSQAHLVLEKYFIVPRKRHFLWREIILHQICKSTLKHKSYLYYPMLQGTHNVQVCLRN